MTDTAERVSAPSLEVLAADGAARAVAVLLPGGRADSVDPTGRRQLTRLRMVPFARSLWIGGRGHGLDVWTVRYRYRGWNGRRMSPLQDVRWTLDQVRNRHGRVPVVLIGHSMGGRAAVHVAGDESVVGAVGLAPWLSADDPVQQLTGRQLLIAHGSLDVVTSPRASRRFAERAVRVSDRVSYLTVCKDVHAMLLRWRTWHRLTTAFTLDLLAMRDMPPRMKGAFDRGYL